MSEATMLSFTFSLVLGVFVASITSLTGCGGGDDGSVVSEGVNNNDVSNNGVGTNHEGNNVVSNTDDGNNDVGTNGVGNDGADDGNDGVGQERKASLRWNPVNYYRSVTYTVFFGKRSSGQAGSCNYENSVRVSKPHAMITDLESNTLYFFAVSANDGPLRSLCSNEVSKLTPF
jgi:hypothetical protein